MGTLQRFRVLRSADLDEFRCELSRFLTPHALVPLGHVQGLVATELAATRLGPISLVYASTRGVELGARLAAPVDYYDINLSLGGHNRISCGGTDVLVSDTTAGIISPDMRAQMQLGADYQQLHVRIERHALERHLETLLGEPIAGAVRFDPAMALRSPAAASWTRAVRLLLTDLDQPGGWADEPLGQRPWTEFLMSGLLLAQPHNYSGRLQDHTVGARRPGPVKRAVELIESDPQAELSLQRLAQVAGVSVRSLQRHFRESVGVSPREYVQQFRLRRAHEDLLAARPGSGVTVADVAFTWGFTHVARFAAAYRQRYGTPPSQTLRAGA